MSTVLGSTKSALDKNFKASASSKNPKITFTVFSHPPDLGSELIIPGNKANKAKGKPKAIPNPAIPAVKYHAPCVSVPANNEPTSGPVQEKDTITSVKAIKKTPITPPALSALLTLLANPLGN